MYKCVVIFKKAVCKFPSIFPHTCCNFYFYLFILHQWVHHRKLRALKVSHKIWIIQLILQYILNAVSTVPYYSSLRARNALTCVSVPVAHYFLTLYSPWQSCNIKESTVLPSALLILVSLSLFPACPTGFFKTAQGDEKCLQCPINSRTTNDGATNCVCRNGYYRTDSDPLEMPCTSMKFSSKLYLHANSTLSHSKCFYVFITL